MALNRFSTLVLACSGLSLAAIAGGCDTTKAPYAAVPDPVTKETYPAVTLDGSLQETTAVDYSAIVFDPATPDRPMSVSVPMRSRADYDQVIVYKFRWFDAQGRQINETEWRREVLPARRNALLKANALNSTATAWRMDVQRSN